jgi:hypothetical protein
MNVVVHKYLMGVRKVQRNIRDFIACKHAKVTVLGVVWAKLERNYVKHMLEKRKQQKRTTGKLKTTDEEFADMDRKTLIEMKNQAKLWERIDTKMEEKIKILKATGVIVLESDEELTDKYMLSPKARWAALNDMLMFLVRETFLTFHSLCLYFHIFCSSAHLSMIGLLTFFVCMFCATFSEKSSINRSGP